MVFTIQYGGVPVKFSLNQSNEWLIGGFNMFQLCGDCQPNMGGKQVEKWTIAGAPPQRFKRQRFNTEIVGDKQYAMCW